MTDLGEAVARLREITDSGKITTYRNGVVTGEMGMVEKDAIRAVLTALQDCEEALSEIAGDTDHPSWRKYKAIAHLALSPERKSEQEDTDE